MRIHFYLNRIAIVLTAFMALGVISCSSDDDTEEKSNNKLSVSGKKLLGAWNIGYYIVFQTEGKCFAYTGKSYDYTNAGSWQYNEQTGLLGTSCYYKDINLQWQITMIGDDTWSGILLHNSKVQAAERDPKHGVILLLTGQKWKNSASNAEVEYKFNVRSYDKSGGFLSMENNSKFSLWLDNVTEDLKNDVILIEDSYDDGFYELHHPYDYKKIYLQYPSGTKYYPVKE